MAPLTKRPDARLVAPLLAGALAVLAPLDTSAAPPKDDEIDPDLLERQPPPDIEELVVDPRKRGIPSRHRFRLALHSHWIRLSEAIDGENRERFHHAPLMVDAGYQVQFAKWLALRPAVAIGYNVANTRNAMPLAFEPQLWFGYQGKLVGFMVGYAFLLTQPATKDATDGRSRSLPQPVILQNHMIRGELSFTTRVDRSALTFATGIGAVYSNLHHIQRDDWGWRPILHFAFGAYFDGSLARERRAEKKRRR